MRTGSVAFRDSCFFIIVVLVGTSWTVAADFGGVQLIIVRCCTVFVWSSGNISAGY